MIDLAPYVQTIERVNQTRNAEPWIVADFDMASGKLVGHDCVAFANEKLRDLIAAGLPPTAVKLVALMTRWGQGHVVVEIDGLYRGREEQVILDNRVPFPVTRGQLEQNGDTFNVRVISTAMEGQFVRPLLKLSGPACTAESPAHDRPEDQVWSSCSFPKSPDHALGAEREGVRQTMIANRSDPAR
jgi:hypothetical protein